MSPTAYSEDNIQTLTDAADIRLRPGMFIGSSDGRGLHYLFRELVLNAVEEIIAAHGERVDVTLSPDGSCAITDDGRGMTDAAILLDQLTRWRTGAELIRPANLRTFTTGWGYCGVMLNAFSEWGEIDSFDDEGHFQLSFERGVIVDRLRHQGPANGRTGLSLRFKPDSLIFGDHTFDLPAILHTLCELAFLNAGVRFTFTDERTSMTDTFHFPGGLEAFVAYLNTGEEALHEPIRFVDKVGAISIEVAFQYLRDCYGWERGYSNGYFARNGGTHIAGFRRGLRERFRRFVKSHGGWSDDLPVMPEDIREGVTVVVHIQHPKPEYEGATRSGLSNADVEPVVAQVVREGLSEFLERNPEVGKRLCEQIALNAEARIAAREARHKVRKANGGS